jgi:hypothetical protein
MIRICFISLWLLPFLSAGKTEPAPQPGPYLEQTSADITEEGRRDLLAWLNHPLLERWTPDLIGGRYRLISRDSMGRLVEEAKERRKKDKFPEIFLHERVYTFSAPIFFQHNSLCLFYVSSYQGSLSASWNVYLFRRNGDQWKMVKSLYSAIS